MNSKKIKIVSIVIFLLFLSHTNIYAASQSITQDKKQNIIFVEGKRVIFDVNPVTEKGVTLVQFKPLFKSLGLSVNFDPKTKKIIAQNDKYNIELQIGNKIALVNNNEVKLAVAPKTIKGNTFVPLKFVAQVTESGFYVDPDTKRIMIGTFWNYNKDRYFDYNWGATAAEIEKSNERELKERFIESDNSGTLVYNYQFSNAIQGSLKYSFISEGLQTVSYITEQSQDLEEQTQVYYSFLNYFSTLYHEEYNSGSYTLYTFGDKITVNVSLSNVGSTLIPEYRVRVYYHEGV
ncbi:copper amine oxidase N-terminal domain-containing protein [Cohnella phaseoli]|uniref:Copper amine oxidase-like protein n=1 Tax=Cohnella phaseoli TaxID=456490 RepID=A0A3D9HQU6_9BACL|nr:copper amine oxidase N-terminal domain-containing protein [Cohnella phaseoli]RED51819.1 copper amine oxidase-like protein [Cohnella phaseoli]